MREHWCAPALKTIAKGKRANTPTTEIETARTLDNLKPAPGALTPDGGANYIAATTSAGR